VARESTIKVEGRIVEVIADKLYRVELSNGHRLVAHVSGRRRLAFKGLALGDCVTVRLSPYDLSRGSIAAGEDELR
jgi:translation initiation factor IF-1